MFHGIIVNCKDSCCSAEATTKLAAGCITPVRITLNAAFDSLPVRYLVTQCADHTERFDISMSLELELPGSCFIPGEKFFVGVWASNEDRTKVIPTARGYCGRVEP